MLLSRGTGFTERLTPQLQKSYALSLFTMKQYFSLVWGQFSGQIRSRTGWSQIEEITGVKWN